MLVDYTGFLTFGIMVEDRGLLDLLDQEQEAYKPDEIPDGRNKPASFYYELLAKNGLAIRTMGESAPDDVLIYAQTMYKSAGCGDVEPITDTDFGQYSGFDVNDYRNKILQVLGELGYTNVQRSDVGWLVGCYQW